MGESSGLQQSCKCVMSAGRHITQRSDSEKKQVLLLSEGHVMKDFPRVAVHTAAGCSDTRFLVSTSSW